MVSDGEQDATGALPLSAVGSRTCRREYQDRPPSLALSICVRTRRIVFPPVTGETASTHSRKGLYLRDLIEERSHEGALPNSAAALLEVQRDVIWFCVVGPPEQNHFQRIVVNLPPKPHWYPVHPR